MSGFASEAKQSGNSLDQRMNQTTGLIQTQTVSEAAESAV